MDRKEKVDNLIEGAAERLATLIDVNTVVGKPIFSASGTQIIPLTKVTMGYLSGGGEYGETKVIKEGENMPFAGGAGAVVGMKPVGFLVDDGTSCRLLRLGDGPLERTVEKAGELVDELIQKYARS